MALACQLSTDAMLWTSSCLFFFGEWIGKGNPVFSAYYERRIIGQPLPKFQINRSGPILCGVSLGCRPRDGS